MMPMLLKMVATMMRMMRGRRTKGHGGGRTRGAANSTRGATRQVGWEKRAHIANELMSPPENTHYEWQREAAQRIWMPTGGKRKSIWPRPSDNLHVTCLYCGCTA